MSIDRRAFLTLGAVALAEPELLAQARSSQIRAVALDGLVVFDTRRLSSVAESTLPGRGAALLNAWRSRQFEYQWLRALGNRYADFLQVTRDSLEFAARSLGFELTAEAREALIDVYRNLDAWPDAWAALHALKSAGLQLAFLSNMTARMLTDGIERCGLSGLFDLVLSTDEVESFKPARLAYGLGVDAIQLARESILFVASAGWDAAGAKWFGYPTYWVNRVSAPDEELDVRADGVGRDMNELLAFVQAAMSDDAAANDGSLPVRLRVVTRSTGESAQGASSAVTRSF